MTTAVPTAPTPIFHPNLPLSVIVESVHNPRKRFDEASLKELADTIQARGIHNPVLVREIDTPAGSRFELAAGHRRCRAARMVGLVEVPALIMQLDDDAFIELLHLDNLQRDDIDPLDEALGYGQLLERGYDLQTIAEKIRKSITYVASRVRLLSLGTAAREAMRLGYVKVSHAIELAKLPEGVQEQLLEDQWNLSPAALLKSAGVPAGDADGTDNVEDEDDASEGDDDADEEEGGDDEYFATPAGDNRFRSVRWRAVTEPTLQDLKRAMALEVFRKLSAVPWDLADETLIPEAGACARCPKRSSMEPLLFAELDSGHDACLDATCFDAKRDAFYDLQRGIAPAARAQQHDDDYETERKERIRAQKQQDQQEQARREKLERERELAQAVRTASVHAILSAIPKAALTQLAWLQVLFLAVVDRLRGEALGQMLVMMKLETEPPEGASKWDHKWKVERLAAWARESNRTATHLTRALVLAALGHETVIFGSDVDNRNDVLLQLAALASVDLETIARETQQTAKAETKQARRKAKAVPA